MITRSADQEQPSAGPSYCGRGDICYGRRARIARVSWRELLDVGAPCGSGIDVLDR